jgi:hypothetical protein
MNKKMHKALFAHLGRISTTLVILSLLFSAAGTIPVKAATTVALVATADNYMRSSTANATQNCGAVTPISVSPSSTASRGSLYKWDLSSIPSGATVTSASLSFYVTTGSTVTAWPIYAMKRAWVEGTQTTCTASSSSSNWNTYDGVNSWGTPGAANTTSDRANTNLWDYAASAFGATGNQTFNLNASGVSVVQGWINTPSSNYGLTMQFYTGSSSAYWEVASRENTSGNTKPTLNITYNVGTTPTITTTGTLSAFNSQTGVASAEQSYTVSGTNLTANIVINAPADFQISTTSGSGFGPSVTLTQSGGTVASRTIYVRFNRATAGTSSGNITHTSSGATTVNMAVSGTATTVPSGWTAYNDAASPYLTGNATQFSISGTTAGLLKDYASGTNTAVTATFTTSGSSSLQSTTNGGAAASGTDAYTTFNGKVDPAGVIACVSSSSGCTASDYIDVTFTGLNPALTYTFATTTVRNGGTSYNTRNARYTISDITSATNASTSGVTVLSNESVWFNAGNNQAEGYVARWTNIVPGSDGDFTVRAQPQGSENQFYGQSLFLLKEDGAITGPNIFVSSAMTAFRSAPGVPSAEKSYTVSGVNLTAGITITPPADFEISTTSGSGFGTSPITLPQSSGSVASTTIYVRFNRSSAGTSSGNITHTSTGATTQNLAVSGTAALAGSWVAYNDSAAAYPTDASKITEISISGTTSGLLKNYDTGEDTTVTATFTSQGNLTNSTGNGAEPDAGTDAYDIFSGKVNMAGVVACTDQASPACADNTWFMDLTFTGLDPTQTYSFATTTVRDGDSANYGARNALFTISDIDSATNASSAGVTVVSNESVWFNAGMNRAERGTLGQYPSRFRWRFHGARTESGHGFQGLWTERLHAGSGRRRHSGSDHCCHELDDRLQCDARNAFSPKELHGFGQQPDR